MTTTPRAVDTDLLIDLLRRSMLLEVLRDERLDRAELQDRLDVSRATCHRHTRLLEELGTIEREDGRFGLTPSGELVVSTSVRFKRETATALHLAPVLEAVADAPVEVDVEAFADATVTSAEHGDPYSPVARFVALVAETETLRGFDVDVIAPVYMDEIQGRIVDGMRTETVVLPEVAENTLEGYPEKCMEACASGHLTVRLRDDLPFGVAILDDRVGIGVPERDSRQLRVFVDTDSPDVRAWAEALYETYESEAVVLEEFTRQGYRQAVEAEVSSD